MGGRARLRSSRGFPLAVALTALVAVSAPARGQNLELVTVRYLRSEGTHTLVEAFCRVPMSVVSALGTRQNEGGAFRFNLTVRDSAGLALTSQSWVEIVPRALLGMPGAAEGEAARFELAPGKYSLEVSVTDSATGLVSRGYATVRAYQGHVAASDLMLGTSLRKASGPSDTVSGPGELRHGLLFIQTSGAPTLTPSQTQLAYYLELYPGHAESLSVKSRVLNAQGGEVIAARPQRVAVDGGGGMTYGIIDLAGLPPGTYRLEVGVTGDSSIQRQASFAMAGFETASAVASAAVSAPMDLLSERTESGLDSLYRPLVYLMNSQEAGQYSSLTVDGKRRWLRDFWSRHGASLRDQYYARVHEATSRFREGGAAGVAGWRTDRGRIFILYGPPDERLDRRNNGTTNPYEVWKYTHDRNLKYVFMDLTRFGSYQLIYTNDIREQSRPNWMDLLGTDGVNDVNSF